MTRTATFASIAAALLATCTLSACTPSSDKGADHGDDKCTNGKITIGVIPKLGDDPYMTTVRDGLMKEAQFSGGGDEVIYTFPSEATGSAQIPFVQQLISKKVDVIAISGSDLKGAQSVLRTARERGIKVVSFDSDVDPSARAVFVNQAETTELGHMMLDSMHDLMGGQGEFAILSSTLTAVNQNAWIADIKKRLAQDPKFKDMRLVDIVYGEEKADVSANRAQELVTAHPNLKGIIVPAGISLPAAANALGRSGELGKIKLTGLAPPTLIKSYIEGGNVQDVWWNVTDLGRLTYHVAKALARCQITGKSGQSLVAGDLGSFKVGAKGEVLLGPARIVTPTNLKEFAF